MLFLDEPTVGLDPQARLFRALNGSRLAASELSLAAGDQIRFVTQDGRVTYQVATIETTRGTRQPWWRASASGRV